MHKRTPAIFVVDDDLSVRRAPHRFLFAFRSASNRRITRTTGPGTFATPRSQFVTVTGWTPRLAVLVFGVVVLGALILLGVGWDAGRRVRRECEAIARELQATGEHQYDVGHCLAARLLNGGA
jgi:hypothetical protein